MTRYVPFRPFAHLYSREHLPSAHLYLRHPAHRCLRLATHPLAGPLLLCPLAFPPHELCFILSFLNQGNEVYLVAIQLGFRLISLALYFLK